MDTTKSDELYKQSQDLANLAGAANADSYYGLGSGLTGDKTKSQNEFNLLSSLATNYFNSAEAQRGREWDEWMKSTEYQRAVKDLAAIGFSPLALMQLHGGNGSVSSPTASGSSASSTSNDDQLGSLALSIAKIIAVIAA